VGDRVTMNPFNPCGECPRCLAGLETRCTKAASDGMGLGGRAGAYAETVTVSESMCIQLPNELDDRRAALSEPVAVGVHAVARAEVTVGEPVVVIGAGPIGVVTAMALRAQGFADVHVIERAFDRRSRVESMGFSASEGEEGYEGDAVAAAFECAGVPETATLAAAMVRPMGRVVLVGMATRPLVFDGIQLVLNETEIRASSAYTRDDFAQAVELLASDAIPGEELISRVADLAEINQVFTDLDGPTTDLKVLLKP
jgi:2-desacetyl-2-hydroxyethyl bacteriochlorophyllide A dehydrogenase